MKFAFFLIAAISVVLVPLSLSANTSTNELIVKFKNEVRPKNLAAFMSSRDSDQFSYLETISEDLGIYKVELRNAPKSLNNKIQQLMSEGIYQYVQPDHEVTLRFGLSPMIAAPNDTYFDSQWSLNQSSSGHIDALLAWDYGVGGVDIDGNDIVVAIVDGGVDVTHEDLVNNIWINLGEVAGDGIDNDGNGYIDDINGWNAFTNTGVIPPNLHGTHVAGIVGASGNNGLGIAGVNWNVQLMGINGASGKTSVVLKAYGYAHKQKKLWLETNGKYGAKVVATNSSFGVDYGDCNSAEFTAWNDIYNEMGKLGILSAVATANIGIDVDVKGDVPSACNSPYVVGVTNTTAQNKINPSAGWGKEHIDLGAPGTAVFSTIPGNLYRNLTGTSMATPHVAGAIAFIDSLVGRSASVLSIGEPSETALLIKQVLIDSVDPIPDLQGRTVSGGRLNLSKAAAKLENMGL